VPWALPGAAVRKSSLLSQGHFADRKKSRRVLVAHCGFFVWRRPQTRDGGRGIVAVDAWQKMWYNDGVFCLAFSSKASAQFL